MFFQSLFGLTARGLRLLSCIASARIAVVCRGEYPRRCASWMIAAATSRGLEFGVNAPNGVPATPAGPTNPDAPPAAPARNPPASEDSPESGEPPPLPDPLPPPKGMPPIGIPLPPDW